MEDDDTSEPAGEAELRASLRDAFEEATYPVNNQMGLVPALPNGPSTTFDAGERTFSAMELATTLSSHQDFPYHDVDSLVDDVIAGLKAEGEL